MTDKTYAQWVANGDKVDLVDIICHDYCKGRPTMETERWDINGTTLTLCDTLSGPEIWVNKDQLKEVRVVLDRYEIHHYPDSNSVSFDGPLVTIIHIAAQHKLITIRSILNNRFRPISGDPLPRITVRGKYLQQNRWSVIMRAADIIMRECEKQGVDISKCDVAIQVKKPEVSS